jgi:hypothetical protein
MITDSVSPFPPDPRFVFVPESKGAKIFSGVKNLIGKVIFDPGATCRKKQLCYTGFSTNGKGILRRNQKRSAQNALFTFCHLIQSEESGIAA